MMDSKKSEKLEGMFQFIGIFGKDASTISERVDPLLFDLHPLCNAQDDHQDAVTQLCSSRPHSMYSMV